MRSEGILIVTMMFSTDRKKGRCLEEERLEENAA